MRKVEKEELHGFWKAVDKENKNEIHIVFRKNGNARFSESNIPDLTHIGKYSILGEGDGQVIYIDASVKIELPIFQLDSNNDSIILVWKLKQLRFDKYYIVD